MIRRNMTTIVASLLVLALAGCATMFAKGGGAYRQGERAYDQGNYHLAVEYAVEALEANPELAEAKDLLDRAFTEGTEQLRSLIAEYEAVIAEDPLSGGIEQLNDQLYELYTAQFTLESPYWLVAGAHEATWKLYELLNDLQQPVLNSSLAGQYEAADYSDRISELRESAAEAYYQAGLEALEAGDVASARKAVGLFTAAGHAVENYKDSVDLLAQAQEAATVKLLVFTSERASEALRGSSAESDKFAENVLNITGAASFTKLVAPDTLGLSADASADQVVSAAAEEGIAFVVYVDGAMGSPSVVGPEQSGQIEFFAGTFGYELSISYTSSFRGTYALYDVASGDQLAADSMEAESGASAKIKVIEPTQQIERTLNTRSGDMLIDLNGTWDAVVSSPEAINYDIYDENAPFVAVFEEAGWPRSQDGLAVSVPDMSLVQLRTADFSQMSELLNDKFIMPGAEAVYVENTGVRLIYTWDDHYPASTVEEVKAMGDKAAEIVNIFRTEGVAMAEAAAGGGGTVANAVANTVGQAIGEYLQ